jgi:hypothetical protein
VETFVHGKPLDIFDEEEEPGMKDIKFSSKRPLTDEEEAEIQRRIANDTDAPEATDEELAQARPFREVFPDLAASIDEELARRGNSMYVKYHKPCDWLQYYVVQISSAPFRPERPLTGSECQWIVSGTADPND